MKIKIRGGVKNNFLLLKIFATTLLFLNCPGKQVRNGGGGKAIPPGSRVVKLRGCIEGRVVKENGEGFPLVKVMTEPPTNFVITNQKGFFKICYKIQESETGETLTVTIPPGTYTIKVEKEGFHARPVTITYKGEKVRVPDILMVEKTKPLPEVVESQEDEEKKRTSGAAGKAPKFE